MSPLHCTPVATCYADLLAMIRATADTLPADARAGVHLAEWRALDDDETISAECSAWHAKAHGGFTGYPHPDGFKPRAGLVSVHGPRAEWGRLSVRYLIDGARGSFTVARSRDALARLADRIATIPAARAALRALQPARPRAAVTWPAVAIKIWRQSFAEKLFADALNIGAARLGALYFGGRMFVAPVPVDGLPDGIVTVCRADRSGTAWVAMDAESGRALGHACGTRKGAEESARQAVADKGADRLAEAMRAARADVALSQAEEMAEWCKVYGIGADALPDAAPVPADAPDTLPAADPEQAAPADAPADIGAALAAVARRLAGQSTRQPAAAPVQAAPAAPRRYEFPVYLIGTDSQRIGEAVHQCAGPGLTSADIAAADAQLADLAAARGLAVVRSGFADGAARAWCQPISAPTPGPLPVNPAPSAPVNPAPAARAPAAPVLPLFARLALERMQADASMRRPAILAELLQAYARTYGTTPDDETAAAALALCAARWPAEFSQAAADPAPVPAAGPADCAAPADALATAPAAAAAGQAAAPVATVDPAAPADAASQAADPAPCTPCPENQTPASPAAGEPVRVASRRGGFEILHDRPAGCEFVSRWSGERCDGIAQVSAAIEAARLRRANPGLVFTVAPVPGGPAGKFEVRRWQPLAAVPADIAAMDDGALLSALQAGTDAPADANPYPVNEAPADTASIRADLIACEARILAAAPARFSDGQFGGDIEAAARHRAVPADLRAQRDALRADLRAAVASQAAAGQLPAPSAMCALILHNVSAPLINAAGGGAPDPAAILAEAARLESEAARVAADCAGLPAEPRALQTLADYNEVARRLRAMVPAPTPCPGIPDDAPADVGPVAPPARELSPMAADWLARVHGKLETDPMPRTGYMLAAQSERDRAARIFGDNAAAARECADYLQARADALQVPPAPTREHLPFDGYGGAWQDIRNGRAEPDEYRAHVMQAMQAAKAAGLVYNSETYPRAAAVMAARWGYPDLRNATEGHGPDCDGVPRWFGSHCYMAHDAIRARAAREARREAREALRLAPGVKLGALVFNDYKLTRAVEVAAVSADGELVTITGNRGRVAVRGELSPLAVRHAIERAHEKGSRRDTYAEFCAGRAAAAPVVSEPEPEPAADPAPAAATGAPCRAIPEAAAAAEFPGLETVESMAAAFAGTENAPQVLRKMAASDEEFARCAESAIAAGANDYRGNAWKARYSAARAAVYRAAADQLESASASLPDTRAALDIARNLVESIDGAPFVIARPRRAIPVLLSESRRLATGADHVPAGLAARYRMASAMLAETAAARDASLPPDQAPAVKPAASVWQPVQRAGRVTRPAPRPGAAPAQMAGGQPVTMSTDGVCPTCRPGWRAASVAQLARPPPGR